MTTSQAPRPLRDPLNTHFVNGTGIAKSTSKNSASLSLEVVKEIWRKYPKLPNTNKFNKVATAAIVQSSSQGSNVLELNLGTQSANEASGGSPSMPTSHSKAESHHDVGGPIDGEPGALPAVSGQAESPTSERAVDDLLPTASDNMDITPALNTQSLPSCGPSQSSPRPNQTAEGSDSISNPPSSSVSSLSPCSDFHTIQEARSVLMDAMQKSAQRRYPNKEIDQAKLSEKFAKKLPDSEVRDFVQMGKEVMDQLRRFGKIDEAKRKYASEGRADAQRQRRRMDSPSHKPDGGSQGSSEAGNSRPTTSARSNNSTHISLPRAPKAMLSNNWKDIPTGPSSTRVPTVSQRHSQLKRDGIEQGSLSPGQILEDDSMSISKTSQPAMGLPPATRLSATMSAVRHTKTPSEHSPVRAASHTNNPGGHMETALPQVVTSPQNPGTARILLAKIGLPSVGLLNASFELDEQLVAASRRWAERSKYFDPSELYMRLHLISIPASAAEHASHELPPNPPPSLLAETVSQIRVTWPQPGTFYVSLNKGRPEAISWAENFFGTLSSALDISSVVVPGKNDIQFIQLDDHSQNIFLVLAIPPNEDERQEALTLHSRRTAWARLSEGYQGKTHVKLQLDRPSRDEGV